MPDTACRGADFEDDGGGWTHETPHRRLPVFSFR